MSIKKQELLTPSGFIQIHRKITEWEWYTDVSTKTLFLHILVKCNYKDKTWRGIKIKRGSFITSYRKLAEETGLSVKNVRTALDHLKATHEVAHQTARDYSLISAINYDNYQTEGHTKRQANGTVVATTNKDNNINKDTVKEINRDFIDDVNLFKEMVETYKGNPVKVNINTWANELRLLKNEVGEDRYSDSLNWYNNNIGKQYIPECYSPASFREKFDKIENAIKRG